MSDTLATVQSLAVEGDVKISDHGYDELAEDDILASDVLAGLSEAELVEDYPDATRGPSVLVLQRDAEGHPIHVVWGIPRGHMRPAVLITAYRPDPERWTRNFVERKKS